MGRWHEVDRLIRSACTLILVLGLTLTPAAPVAADPSSPARAAHPWGPVDLPDSGALFGVHLSLDEHNGFERRQAMLDFEALVGRKMALERIFYAWDDPFPTADDYWSNAQGRLLYLSWNAGFRDEINCAGWADIAAGLHDDAIDAQAEAIKAFGDPLILSFHHEPTTGPPSGELCGTPEEYVAAWRHFRQRMDSRGVANATYAWTMTAQSFKRDNAEPFYPGDDVIDVIGADGYNWFGCPFHPGPWREWDEIFLEFFEFAEVRGKPMVIAEYGSGEDPNVEGKKARWFTNAADTIKQHPLVKGISYFNVGGGACARYADSSPSSLQRFQTNGADPYFNPPVALAAVEAADFAFSPRRVTVDRGAGVEWTFKGPGDCSVSDTSGMQLFDSGTKSPGDTFRFFFIAAGGYPYECAGRPGMTGKVTVPMEAVPRSGDLDTAFTVMWAANFAPDGWAFDVQIRRPGAGWSEWKTGRTSGGADFTADAGTGTYRFRARLRSLDSGAESLWSRSIGIRVT